MDSEQGLETYNFWKVLIWFNDVKLSSIQDGNYYVQKSNWTFLRHTIFRRSSHSSRMEMDTRWKLLCINTLFDYQMIASRYIPYLLPLCPNWSLNSKI